MEPITQINLPRRITQNLKSVAGASDEEKVYNLAKQGAIANLHECNNWISRFESRYGITFSDFASAWNQGQVKNAHDYQTETDFIEWEALEQEKEHWLSEIRHFNVLLALLVAHKKAA